MTNIQLKAPGAWLVLDSDNIDPRRRLQDIANQITAIWPDLAIEDPTQFPSLVAKAQELWIAQSVVAAHLGGTEVPQQAPVPQPQAWSQPPRQQYQAPQYQQPATQNVQNPQGVAGAPLDQFGKPMKWIEGVSNKTGKPYKGWFGDYQKGDPQGAQVAPQFVR